jgi:hypothetical protein
VVAASRFGWSHGKEIMNGVRRPSHRDMVAFTPLNTTKRSCAVLCTAARRKQGVVLRQSFAGSSERQ